MNQNKSNKPSQKVTKDKKGRKNLANDGYVRPKVTASEMLSSDQIKKRLKNYSKVQETDLPNLVDGDRVRYFEILGAGKFKYKPGGYVLVNGAPDYLVLTNNGANWSVQLANHVIFKAIDIDLIEEEHKLEIDKFKRNEEHLYKLLIKQKNVITRLRGRIEELEQG